MFVASAVLSLLLSPITVIYAALIGSVGLCVTLTIHRARPTLVAVFGGILAGSLPYLIAGLAI
ncbi:hypothetical protein OHR68_35385 [Spirillospora sp. NBC_00431]